MNDQFWNSITNENQGRTAESDDDDFNYDVYFLDERNLTDASNLTVFNSSFVWFENQFVPKIFPFELENVSGIQMEHDIGTMEIDFFKLFLDRNFVEFISNETNRQYRYVKDQSIKSTWRLSQWHDTSVDEIYLFFSVCLLMTCNSRNRVEDYWSTDVLLHSPIYSDTMARNRYQAIMRMLHFCDNRQQTEGDKIFKVRYVIEHFRNAFRKYFYPQQNLSLDEIVLLFKGHSETLFSTDDRFGIKFFLLCDSAAGYVLDFIIDSDKKDQKNNVPYSNLNWEGNMVMILLQNYFDRGHSVYIGSQYSSPKLFHQLYHRKTNACGSVRRTEKDLPKIDGKLAKGELKIFHNGIISYQYWKETQEISMLSTFHRPTVSNTGRNNNKGDPVIKPQCFQDFTRQMMGMNKCDNILASIHSSRRGLRWYTKLFFILMDLALLNAHTLFQIKMGKKVPFIKFHMEVIRQLIKYHGYKESSLTIERITKRKSDSYSESLSTNTLKSRLDAKYGHFIERLPSTGKKSVAMARCSVCTINKIRRETRYRCKQCLKALCVDPCFEIFHTVEDVAQSKLFTQRKDRKRRKIQLNVKPDETMDENNDNKGKNKVTDNPIIDHHHNQIKIELVNIEMPIDHINHSDNNIVNNYVNDNVNDNI